MQLAPIEFLQQRTPLPEATELPPETAWQQWDLAVRLQDANPTSGTSPAA